MNTLEDFGRTLYDRHRAEWMMVGNDEVDIQKYWEHRAATVQIEWVHEICKVHMIGSESQDTLSARAVMFYNTITTN